MDDILQIKNLSKTYDGFCLDHVTFSVPKGCIMGLIGENGAGKSTAIKLILDLIHRESGEILLWGRDNRKDIRQMHEKIGVVLEESGFSENIRVGDVNRIMRNIFASWQPEVFLSYMNRFSISTKKEIKELSRGMKTKLSIAVALSHQTELLILDEPTSGLDPVVREEILDIFLEFIQEEEHAILISSHITGDLEKVADYITFLHEGKIIFSERKDELLEQYGIVKCSASEFEALDKSVVCGYRKNEFGVEALVLKNRLKGKHMMDPATIEEIMLFYIRGNAK